MIRQRFTKEDTEKSFRRLRELERLGIHLELPDSRQVAMDRAEEIGMDFQVGDNPYINEIKKHDDRIVLIFGPPAAGKDTVKKILLDDRDRISMVRTTTRPPYEGEVDHVDYHFLPSNMSPQELSEARKASVLSYKFHDYYYWYDAKEMLDLLITHKDSFLLLGFGSAEGVKKMKEILPECTSLCIIPGPEEGASPEDIIERRLRVRGRETGERLEERIRIGRDQFRKVIRIGDYIIVNPTGHPEKAAEDIKRILNEKRGQGLS